jgi:hypothetical protein
MPDAVVKRDPDTLRGDSAAKTRRTRAVGVNDIHAMPAAQASADAEKKLARAARSAQRLAQLSEGARGGETLDLFAEDAERAQLQAMNTDIRQGTFEGFELPEVFLAAVQSNCSAAPAGASAQESAAGAKRAARGGATSAEPERGLFQDELPHLDAPQPGRTGAIAAVAVRSASVSTSVAPESAARSLAAATSDLIARDRDDRGDGRADGRPLAKADANAHAPELDRARATAFADTIDALYAVMAEQRTSAAVHARRMKTMLTIIVCVMLLTVATGIAQTALLLRMSHDDRLQQDRTEQLMLNQQATLASLFDTDSATVSLHRPADAPPAADDASPMQPVNAAQPDSASKKHAHHPHHRAPSPAR